MREIGGSAEPGDDVPPGSAGAPASGAAGQVARALALLEEGARLLGTANHWALSDGEARVAVRSVYEVSARVESAKLRLLADLDGRATAVAGARAPYVGQTFLVHGLNVSPGAAKRDVLAARALFRPDADDVPELPRLAAALTAGEVNREHVDSAVKVWAKVPAHVAADGGMARIDAFLTEESKRFGPKEVDRLGRELLATAAPDGDTFDPESVRRRFLAVSTDQTGMLVGRFQLDPVGGAAVKAMLDHLSRSDQGDAVDTDGQPVLVTDARSLGQRRADALVAGARLAMAADPGTARQERPHVLVVADPDQVLAAQDETRARAAGLSDCVQTGPLRPGVLGQLLCDCILQAVTLGPAGDVLNLGRAQRTASQAQRRALAARDRGCARPGCTQPPAACDAHHAVWWSSGGATDLENLVLLCARDHTLVHAGLLHVEMHDGVPCFRDLDGDPNAPPARNPWPQELARARELGQQLRLDADDG